MFELIFSDSKMNCVCVFFLKKRNIIENKREFKILLFKGINSIVMQSRFAYATAVLILPKNEQYYR